MITYTNWGLSLLFLCNHGWVFRRLSLSPFSTASARSLFGVVFLHKWKQDRLLCPVSTHKSYQRRVHWLGWEHQILKGPINFSSLPLIMGIAMSLWWEKLLRAFVSGQSGVRSGNSIDLHVFGYKTQCCTQFKSPGDKILCVLYLHFNVAFTFKWYGNSWNKTVYSQRVWIGYSIELAE